ncbi:HDIG domain-containing protein [bacterium]|nr:HDIG domain-containing protein [bacterium]
MVPYFSIIEKYINPGSKAFRIYTIHVTNVTRLALHIAQRQGLTPTQLQFIEEAAMLHDIGIVKTKTPEIGCYGDQPYLRHLTAGKKILKKEGLPLHARVAANHVGVGGLSKEDIVKQKLPLPAKDILCETIEERIISYADLFYTKNPKNLWRKKTFDEIVTKLDRRPEHQERFKEWYIEFGE